MWDVNTTYVDPILKNCEEEWLPFIFERRFLHSTATRKDKDSFLTVSSRSSTICVLFSIIDTAHQLFSINENSTWCLIREYV